MDTDYTHITVILDCSGSMESIRSDTIGGFNSFLKTHQEAPGRCTMTVGHFNDHYSLMCSANEVRGVSQLTDLNYTTSGTTALLDAIGRGIEDTGIALRGLRESRRPVKVLFVIITDGLENASRRFKRAEVLEKIKHQTDVYKWEFVYIGANQDAIAEARNIGITAANAIDYSANAGGTQALYRSLGLNTARMRSGDATSCAFSAEDRQAQSDAQVGS